MNRRTLAAVSLAIGALLSVPAPAAESAAGTSYPLTLTRGSRLMVDTRINGHSVKALLDSAAESTLIDRKVAESLQVSGGTAVTGQGSGAQSFEAAAVKGVTLQAFGLTLKDQTVAVVDLSDVGRRLLGHSLDVVLGREVFDAARLQIDIEGKRITVIARDPKTVPRGVELALVTENGIETLPVRIEDHDGVRAAFDLGNGSETLIGAKLADQLHLLSDGRPNKVSAGGGLGGELQRQVVILRSLDIAGQRITDLPAAIDTRPSATDVNIGIAVLRRFLITTDFARHAVWLEPRASK
ncbi:MAG: retropepsin-like domain-containing protein [Proteobacteria bacterium]|nr:retropepsin-like domain-containing protein [Pseudomonadota bacterium]